MVEVLIEQLRASIKAVKIYNHKVESFFASSPAAQFAKTLPGGKSGTLVAAIWAELGDAQKSLGILSPSSSRGGSGAGD